VDDQVRDQVRDTKMIDFEMTRVSACILYRILFCYLSRTVQTPSQARANRPKCVHIYTCTQISIMRIYVFI